MLRQLIKILLRSGNKKGMDTLLKTHGDKITARDIKEVKKFLKPPKKGTPYPVKSKGVPGREVMDRSLFGPRSRRERDFMDWNENRMELAPYPVKSKYATEWMKANPSPVNPLKARIRARILQMRKDPGMARGLQRMESRKASAFNTPGVDAPWSGDFTERILRRGHKLRYEPTAKRNFINMLRTDKDFESFVVDMVGRANVAKVMNNPKARKQLMRQFTNLSDRTRMNRAVGNDYFLD